MSLLSCVHCDENFDSDFEEYCPRCNNTDEQFEHPDMEMGEECPYCGVEVGEKEIKEEMRLAKREWDLERIINKNPCLEIP